MSPVKTSHIGSPERQNRERYRRPSKTSGTPHVNRLVTFPPCRSHRGKDVEKQTHHQGDTGAQESAVFWEPWGAPLLPKNRVCILIHPKQFGPFPKRQILPFPDEEILSGYEEDVSSIRDGFSAWVTPRTL